MLDQSLEPDAKLGVSLWVVRILTNDNDKNPNVVSRHACTSAEQDNHTHMRVHTHGRSIWGSASRTLHCQN